MTALGFLGSAFGIVGLETAFPVLYTKLVRPGILSLEKLLSLLSRQPRERFGLPVGEDYSVWDLDDAYLVDPAEFLSKGRATPFAGMELFGRCLLTVCGGKPVYSRF